MSARATTEMDAMIGARVRDRRREQKITQSELGAILGISFQQVQKYESGTNRIGSGRLAEIARVLETNVSSLFGTEPKLKDQLPPLLATKLNFRLLLAFARLDKQMARQFVTLAELMATKNA